MKTLQGPGLFLAQFVSDQAPFNSLAGLASWASRHGFSGLQLPTSDLRIMDLELAAQSRSYCDELRGTVEQHGMAITELSAHLQGQLVAVHPAYDRHFDAFAPPAVRGNAIARQQWAVQQLMLVAQASANLGLENAAAFTGSLAWPYLYPWPQRAPGSIAAAFDELARRWRPILDAFDQAGANVCFELHPGEDVFDGVTFEMFLNRCGEHSRCCILYDPSHLLLQQMDYLGFVDVYASRIRMFHVKDAEFRPTARQGVYGGYQPWLHRAGRFRSVGDGQVDFKAIFSKFATLDYAGWAVLEWECCLKNPEDGAREGAAFIARHIIKVTDRAFDDFAA